MSIHKNLIRPLFCSLAIFLGSVSQAELPRFEVVSVESPANLQNNSLTKRARYSSRSKTCVFGACALSKILEQARFPDQILSNPCSKCLLYSEAMLNRVTR